MKKNNKVSLADISPYDNSYPAKLLSDVFNFQLKHAHEIVDSVYDDVSKLQDVSSLDGLRLIERDGQFFTEIPGLDLQKIDLSIPVSGFDLGMALQLCAIQESLKKMSMQIMQIDNSVRDILNGQQNDRIALYYSGVSLYLESQCVSNEAMKNSLIAQSIKSLTESIFKLTLMMQSDVRYLKNKEYESIKKYRANAINEKMDNIDQCFSIIHQSFILKAAMYCKQGEMLAACTVLENYSRFIKENVTCNASLLVECDCRDKGKENEGWKSRCHLQLEVSNLVKQLSSKSDVLYLERK